MNSLLPFVFIIVVTMIKDGLEDILRHITDSATNSKPVSVFTDGQFSERQSRNIFVGDLIYVSQDEEIPADIIVLATSGAEGVCYVNTMNLDGEANLKTKRANLSLNSFITKTHQENSLEPLQVSHHSLYLTTTQTDPSSVQQEMVSDTPISEIQFQREWKSTVHQIEGNVTCQGPSRSLVDFAGRIEITSPSDFGTIPVDDNQLLLKGCTLKNTEAVVGLVVFTGTESKIQLNSQGAKAKMSRLEWRLNVMVIIIFFVNIVFVIITGLLQFFNEKAQRKDDPYLQWPSTQSASRLWIGFGAALILFSYLIPISLFVSIEFARLIQKCFMESDRRLRGRKTQAEEDKDIESHRSIRLEKKLAKTNGQEFHLHPPPDEDPIEAGHMVCRTTTLNEELGMVEHIFTDKTGTLTQNKMVFKRCSLGAELFEFESEDDPVELQKQQKLAESKMQSHLGAFSPISEDIVDDGESTEMTTIHDTQTRPRSSNSRVSKVFPTDSDHAPKSSLKSTLPDLKSHLAPFARQDGLTNPLFLQFHTGAAKLPLDTDSSSVVTRSTFHFITALLLCHDAIAEQIDLEREEEERKNRLQSQSVSVVNLLKKNVSSVLPIRSSTPKTPTTRTTTLAHSFTESVLNSPQSSAVPIYRFQSTSPDDIAFLNMLQASGFTFTSRTTESLNVGCGGEILRFEIVASLPFTSARRRMSVVVRCPDGTVRLYIKGADSTILPMCVSAGGEAKSRRDEQEHEQSNDPAITEQSANDVQAKTVALIDDLSRGGYRTLCVCQREISPAELDEWLPMFKNAECSVEDRAGKVEAAFVELEGRGMELVGCTGVEDKLQDGCAETIDYFIQAGVRVWILTGDKVDTAVNIAFSCQLLKQNTITHFLTSDKLDEMLKEHPQIGEKLLEGSEMVENDVRAEFVAKRLIELRLVRLLQKLEIDSSKWTSLLCEAVRSVLPSLPEEEKKEEREGRETAMIVDGWCVHNILQSDALMDLFLLVSDECDGVVCCRIAPIQKALVVRMVKVKRKKVCLAIGDGANDVSMIQEAHVGVGIQGLEGLNASQNADYSIAQFRFLKRLCSVHGHFNLNRFASLIKYSFLKNMIFTTVLFAYQFTNGFSQQICFEDWFGTLFNLVFTSIPIMVVVLTDKDVPDWVMLKCPSLYKKYRTGRDLNLVKMLGWPVTGVIVGVSFHFLMQWIFGKGDLVTQQGKSGQYDHYIGIVDTTVLALVSLIVLWFSNFWSLVFVLIVSVSFAVYLVVMVVINVIRPLSPLFYFSFFHLWTSPLFFLSFFSILVVCFVPFTIISYLRRRFFPTARDKALSSFNRQLLFQHTQPAELEKVKYIHIRS
ncbi:ion-transporting P-type ATPase [Blattamonas nauphoetae]|uniref:Phospholipid-transporting ATPase n=1 Tax=Blattamonas nauphoetae TaxID=2049346 RepID=A0ABQ9WU55_9EUKA|nr:ion-transporting P-type ATPase [Blattamonas nauphoetae]